MILKPGVNSTLISDLNLKPVPKTPAILYFLVQLLLIFNFSILSSCTSGPCRKLKHPELANTSPTGSTPVSADASNDGVLGAASSKSEDTPGTTSGISASEGRILVARPDGSLQCKMAKGKSPEEMEKDLDGIKVYSRHNRSDGKMHIQVCGSPTGKVNVYEIPGPSLKEADRRGFKKFDP